MGMSASVCLRELVSAWQPVNVPAAATKEFLTNARRSIMFTILVAEGLLVGEWFVNSVGDMGSV